MTRLTKATLILSGIMLAVIAEAAVISSAWTDRGFFAVGGEWLVPAVVWGLYIAGREIRRLYGRCVERENYSNNLKKLCLLLQRTEQYGRNKDD